jgi:hypothetical protein
MFSLKIINTRRFLTLPSDTQNLYFHLCLHADDDGIVEAYAVMKVINASEDSLKLLHAKEFVKVLNDDLVTFITDWKGHNTIRADRKVDSIYKNLLVQIVPEIELIAAIPRSDIKDNSKRLGGQSTDSPRTVHGQHRLDQVSIDKSNKDLNTFVVIDKSKKEFSHDNELFDQVSSNEQINNTTTTEAPVTTKCQLVPFEQIMNEFNTRCTKQPHVLNIKGARQKHVKSCWKENPTLDYFINLFDEVNRSVFLNGGNSNAWLAGFDWIIKPTSRQKILEGNYKNKPKPENSILPNGRAPNYANFDQREYDEKEIEQFYITASNKRR